MKSIKYCLLFILLAGINSIQAEEKRMPSPEEMQLKKWEYLVITAKLSPKESEAVKPVFMEYESSIWDLHKKNRPMRKDKNVQPNYEELNEKYIERETKQAELLKRYHSELKKILSPETLHNYYKAENSYKRLLIEEMQNHRKKHEQGESPNHRQK